MILKSGIFAVAVAVAIVVAVAVAVGNDVLGIYLRFFFMILLI